MEQKDINVVGSEEKEEYPEKEFKHLEEEYPLHDRRIEGYKLVGFAKGASPSPKKVYTKNAPYPYGMVPVWKYLGWDMDSRYDGEALRKLRAERGVGKIKKNV